MNDLRNFWFDLAESKDMEGMFAFIQVFHVMPRPIKTLKSFEKKLLKPENQVLLPDDEGKFMDCNSIVLNRIKEWRKKNEKPVS